MSIDSWKRWSCFIALTGVILVTEMIWAAPPSDGDPQGDEQPVRAPVPAVAPSEDPALLIGIFRLRESGGVVDGDTLRVTGVANSLRLLAIDTEEVARASQRAELTELMLRDFPAYVEKMGSSLRPTKYPTPMGNKASAFAEAFFAGEQQLRLERDEPQTGKDIYGRTLCYVWSIREGQAPQLYNLEVVRAGLSPYYVKYGRSIRFDAAFRAAQAEAQAAARGIWDPAEPHYPDYATRLAWWERRGEALARFATLQARGKAPLLLGNAAVLTTLQERVGQRVRVFGIVDEHEADVLQRQEGKAILRLGGASYIEIEIIGDALLAALELDQLYGEAICVEGVIDRDGAPLANHPELRSLRIVVREPQQLVRGWLLPTD